MALTIGPAAVADVRIGAGHAAAVYAGAVKVWPVIRPSWHIVTVRTLNEGNNLADGTTGVPAADIRRGFWYVANVDEQGRNQRTALQHLLNASVTLNVDGAAAYTGTVTALQAEPKSVRWTLTPVMTALLPIGGTLTIDQLP